MLDTYSEICLRAQGHALYYGRAQLADAFFACLGAQLPYRVNVADFVLDLASGDAATEGRCAHVGAPALWTRGARETKRGPL